MKEENSMMPVNLSMISGLEWKHQGKSCITHSNKLCPLAREGGDEHIAFDNTRVIQYRMRLSS